MVPGAAVRAGVVPTFAPRFFQTPPRDQALAIRHDFASIRLSRRLSPPSCRTCSAHKKTRRRELLSPPQFTAGFCIAQNWMVAVAGLEAAPMVTWIGYAVPATKALPSEKAPVNKAGSVALIW